MKIKNYFKDLKKVDSVNIKIYYLELFTELEPFWKNIF